MPDWLAYFTCRSCGEMWVEDEAPEGFMDIVLEVDRREFVEKFLEIPKPHSCGIVGGLADCTELLRSGGTFDWMNNEKEVPSGLVGN